MSNEQTIETHAEPGRPAGYRAELRDAVAPRIVLLVAGVLLLQLAFIWSYTGAFHSPRPHRIAVAVTGPAGPTVASRLNQLPGEPLQATAITDAALAERQLRDGTVYAVLAIDGAGTRDTLLTSSALGSSVTTAVTGIFTTLQAQQHRQLTVTDAVPLQQGDYHGLTGFYLVIGWLVGGYLVASLLGVARGSRPATLRRARWRLAAMIPYAIISGLGGALVTDQLLGALTGHFLALWWLGAIVVASAATATMALQIMFGYIGIGVTILFFVVLGNPSATGAYQVPLLPPFWRAIAYWLPNGAATDTVRRLVYFNGNGITGHLIVLCAWIMGGAIVTVLAAWTRHRRATTRTIGSSPRTAAASA
jgi:hypothetical protein